MSLTVRVTSTLTALEADMTRIATTADRDIDRVVETVAMHGNELAKRFATQSSGAHGKHYPNAFRATKNRNADWVYGPSRAFGEQGDMSFEYGSRNQPPHLDLGQSTDVSFPELHHRLDTLIDGFFW